VDFDALLPFPDQCPYAFDGPDETRRRNPERSSDYFLNVPLLLERMRTRIGENVHERDV